MEDKFTVAKFQKVLKLHKEIELCHAGRRYKAKSVTKVLYPLVTRWDKFCCDTCQSKYVVVAGGIIFYVRYYPEGASYYGEAEVDSFGTLERLKTYLIDKIGNRGVLAVLPDSLPELEADDSDSY